MCRVIAVSNQKGVVGKTGSITPIAPNKNAINPTAI